MFPQIVRCNTSDPYFAHLSIVVVFLQKLLFGNWPCFRRQVQKFLSVNSIEILVN